MVKLSREEAYEILEVEEGADHGIIKKAYFKKSREWHPDKRAPEEKDEATGQFQRISAAYQKLIKEDDSSDEEEFEDADDLFYSFFEYMQAKMEAHRAQHYAQRQQHRGGSYGGGGYGGGGGGGMFGGGGSGGPFGGMGGIPIPTPFGFMFVGGPGMGMGGGGMYRGGGGDGGSGKPHQARHTAPPPRQQPQRGRQYEEDSDEWETDDDDDYTTISDDDEYWESQKEREFLRMKAEERAREQVRVRAEYEAALRQARYKEDTKRWWLQQLSRPTRTTYNESSMTLSVARGAKSRMADGKLPEQLSWELQYRTLHAGVPPGEWTTLKVETALEGEVSGLDPGTKYSFRARACVREEVDEKEIVECGEWSVESQYVTAGTAPMRQPAAAHAAAAPGTGKKARRRTNQGDSKPQPAKVVDEEAERERIRAQQEKEAAIQAAIAAAAADYAEHASAAPSAQQAQQGAGAAQSKKAKKKAKKKAAAEGGEGSGPCQPASEPLSRTTSTVEAPAPAGGEGTPVAVADHSFTPEEFVPRYDPGHPTRPARNGVQPAMPVPTRPLSAGGSRRAGQGYMPPGVFGAGAGAAGAGAGVPAGIQSRPSQAGYEAASGNDASRTRLAREASQHGMTVEQYVAHQEDLALQEAIELSLALEESRKLLHELEESRKLLDELEPPPEVGDGNQFPELGGSGVPAGPGPSSATPSPVQQQHPYQQPPMDNHPTPQQIYQPLPPPLQQQPARGGRGRNTGREQPAPRQAPFQQPQAQYQPYQQATAQQYEPYGNYPQSGQQYEPYDTQQYESYGAEQYQQPSAQQYELYPGRHQYGQQPMTPSAPAQDFQPALQSLPVPPPPQQQAPQRSRGQRQPRQPRGGGGAAAAATAPQAEVLPAEPQEAARPPPPPTRRERGARPAKQHMPRQQTAVQEAQQEAQPAGRYPQPQPQQQQQGPKPRKCYEPLPRQQAPIPAASGEQAFQQPPQSQQREDGAQQQGDEGRASGRGPPRRRAGFQVYEPPPMRGGPAPVQPGSQQHQHQQPAGRAAQGASHVYYTEADLLQAAYGGGAARAGAAYSGSPGAPRSCGFAPPHASQEPAAGYPAAAAYVSQGYMPAPAGAQPRYQPMGVRGGGQRGPAGPPHLTTTWSLPCLSCFLSLDMPDRVATGSAATAGRGHHLVQIQCSHKQVHASGRTSTALI